MGLKENLERRETSTLYNIVKENDRTEWQEEAIEAAKKILKERGVDIPAQKAAKEPVSSASGDSGKRDHKIISGPVLSGQEQLEKELSRLGDRGWGLIDTQRHSIAGKQHAVCFLRKNTENQAQNQKLDEIIDKLSKLLELLEEIPDSTRDKENPSSAETE